MSESKDGQSRKGFASNPHLINRSGRPKGSRNKSSLIKAQLQFDGSVEGAAKFLADVMNNNKDDLGVKDDVPMSLRIAAAKEIINKTIANEKDKIDEGNEKADNQEQDTGPIFSRKAVNS